MAGEPPNHRVSGPLVQIMEIIGDHLQICVEFVIPADNKYGSQLPNGTWTGVIEMVRRREANMSGVTLSIDAPRAEVVDFSVPLFMDEHILTARFTGGQTGIKLQVIMISFRVT
ncbi:probable glutamate receptor [Penaeus vannamei]|uniref:probable glutamate receptor n=1 Tax=Penaeus vannamei TaxID=6689 RepID=UPI00387F424E